MLLNMKYLRAFSILALSALGVAAKKSSLDAYKDYHSLSLSSTPLKLDDGIYDELTATPRNHSFVVLLTALQPQFGCQLCRDIQPEWDLLARSWTKGDKAGESRVLFGTLDFANGKGTFQKVCLSIFSIPWIRQHL